MDTNLVFCVAVSPHRATLVNDPVDHDADALLSVHLAPEHLGLGGLGPDLLLLPQALHHLLPHQLQQVRTTINLSGNQTWDKTLLT